jgi:hypothetical protein
MKTLFKNFALIAVLASSMVITMNANAAVSKLKADQGALMPIVTCNTCTSNGNWKTAAKQNFSQSYDKYGDRQVRPYVVVNDNTK